jgi:hypothetical protein
MNPHIWSSTAVAALLEPILETRKSLARFPGEITSQTARLHFEEHLQHTLQEISQQIRDEADVEFKNMLQQHKKKIVIFRHWFNDVGTIEKHYWLYQTFKVGWRGCQRLKLAHAEDVFLEVQADMLERELREMNGDGDAVPAASRGEVPALPASAPPAGDDAPTGEDEVGRRDERV